MFQRRFYGGVRRAGLILTLVLMLVGALLPAAVSAAPAAAPAEQTGGFWYTVQRGDNLTRIANRYGTTVQAIMRANGLYSSVIQPGQVLFIPSGHHGGGGHPGGSCAQVHIVQRGETLTGIARWYGVSVHQLAAANHLANPSHIYVGQRLCIPGGWGPDPEPPPWPQPGCGQFYTVQRGDNLTRIAQWCGTTVHSLVAINGIKNPSRIYVGQVLRIW